MTSYYACLAECAFNTIAIKKKLVVYGCIKLNKARPHRAI